MMASYLKTIVRHQPLTDLGLDSRVEPVSALDKILGAWTLSTKGASSLLRI